MSADLQFSSAVLHERLLTRLRLRHLKLIDALATHAHLRRAAEAVHISQPAATQMLRELEALLGVPLFERHARGMRITAAGRLLAQHARMAIDALRVAADGLSALAAHAHRPLRVGAIDAAVASVLQPALPAFQRKHPALRLVIEDGSIERLRIGLRSGVFDLVLLRQPSGLDEGQHFVPLRNDRMVVVAGAAHPAARRKRLKLRDLADSRWMLPPPHYAVRRALEAAWARETWTPRMHTVQTLSPHLMVSVLSQPDVVAPVPHTMLDRIDRAAVVDLKLQIDAPIEPLGMLYSESNVGAADGALALLIDFLAAHATDRA